MKEHRARAYRLLLYDVLLEIRGLEFVTYRPLRLLNPFRLRARLRDATRAGALADWLHNLAEQSAGDFSDFNEEWFWQHYEETVKEHGAWRNYRRLFETRLSEGAAAAGVGAPSATAR